MSAQGNAGKKTRSAMQAEPKRGNGRNTRKNKKNSGKYKEKGKIEGKEKEKEKWNVTGKERQEKRAQSSRFARSCR